MMPRLSWILLLAASPIGAQQPVITTVDTHSEAEFRGLHVLPGGVIWASGNGGRYVVSEDSGESWRADSVPGAEAMFFVDVHAFDARHALLAGTSFDGGEARLYRTADGGRTWTLAWQLKHPAVFLDGIAFWDARRGIAFGDPVEAVHWKKRNELIKSSHTWIDRHGRAGEAYRFDVVGVLVTGTRVRVRHVENAFLVNTRH